MNEARSSFKLLFVCLGNICRSPSAEAIAVKKAHERGLDWVIDSAGTSGYHSGEKADARSIQYARVRGYDVTSISRQVHENDFKEFDWIIGMDASNVENLKKICPDPVFLSKITLMTDYCVTRDCIGVPDPYYGGKEDFEIVIDILEDAVEGLIQKLNP